MNMNNNIKIMFACSFIIVLLFIIGLFCGTKVLLLCASIIMISIIMTIIIYIIRILKHNENCIINNIFKKIYYKYSNNIPITRIIKDNIECPICYTINKDIIN